MERWLSLFREFEVALAGVLGLVGFLGGIAFVINGNFCAIALPLKPVSASIHMWLLLIGVQGAFWAVVLPYMIMWILELRPKGANVRGEFLARVGLPAAAVAGTLIVLRTLIASAKSKPSPWPPSALNGVPIGNLQWFTIFGIIVAAIGVCGMFVVNWRMAADGTGVTMECST